MGAVSFAHYLLAIVLIHGLVLSQTIFTLTGVVAAARLGPSSESGTPSNIEPARVPVDPTPPPPCHNDPPHFPCVSLSSLSELNASNVPPSEEESPCLVHEVAHQQEMVGVFCGISTSSTNAGIGIMKNSSSGKIGSTWNAIEMCFPEKFRHFERNGSGSYELHEGLIDFIKRGREMSVSGFGRI
ncbi:hypothetical protein Ancab_000976 [Ancistrocladus abbreviatus]